MEFIRNNNRWTETNYYYDASNRLIMEKIVNRTNNFIMIAQVH